MLRINSFGTQFHPDLVAGVVSLPKQVNWYKVIVLPKEPTKGTTCNVKSYLTKQPTKVGPNNLLRVLRREMATTTKKRKSLA